MKQTFIRNIQKLEKLYSDKYNALNIEINNLLSTENGENYSDMSDSEFNNKIGITLTHDGLIAMKKTAESNLTDETLIMIGILLNEDFKLANEEIKKSPEKFDIVSEDWWKNDEDNLVFLIFSTYHILNQLAEEKITQIYDTIFSEGGYKNSETFFQLRKSINS